MNDRDREGAVVVDGTDGPGAESRPGRAAVAALVSAAAVLGFFVGATVPDRGPAPSPGDDDAAGTTVTAVETTTTTMGTVGRAGSPAVSVPWLDGVLTVLLTGGSSPGSGSDVVVWPVRHPEGSRYRLPGVFEVSIDVTHRLLAARGPAADSPDSILYVGRPQRVLPLTFDVDTFAWDATRPGELAWIDSTGRLSTASVDIYGRVAARSTVAVVPEQHRLVGWGEWGFLVRGWDAERGEVMVRLLGPSGAEVWSLPGEDAFVLMDGSILLARFDRNAEPWEVNLVVTDVSGETGAQWTVAPDVFHGATGWVVFGPVPAAGASVPTMSIAGTVDGRVALFTDGPEASSYLDVWSVDGSLLSRAGVGPGGEHVSWTPDGRFVIATSRTTNVVYFFDTVTGIIHDLRLDGQVRWAVVR